MTVQDVKIVDARMPSEVAWAREVTLNRLVQLTDQQNDFLSVMAKVDRKANLDTKATQKSVDKLTDSTASLTDALGDNEDAVKKSAAAQKAYSRSLKDSGHLESINDLRNSMNRLSRSTSSPADAFEVLTDKLAVFGGRLTEKTGSLNMAGRAVQGFTKALTAASFAFGALAGITDPFRGMVESGILFEGSSVRFARSVFDSGLNLQQFTRIAGQYSETVSAVGGQAYTESIRRFRDSAQQFGYYGMNMEELADAQTRYMNIMRESGTLFNMSARQQDAATDDYLKNLTAVSILQGKSRRQLEEEGARATRRAQVSLTIERIKRTEGAEAAELVSRNYRELVNRVGQTTADVQFAQQFGLGGPTREEARALAPSGMIEPAMAPMDLRSRESMERFIQQYQQRATTLPVDTLAMLAQQARFGTGAAAAATELGESILPRARPEQEGAQAQIRQQQAAAARRGQIIDRTTERVLTAQIAGAEALNSLKSAALGAAEQLGILRGVAEAAAAAAGVASAGAGGLSGITGTMGGALLAGGGLAAGYLATKIGPLLTAFRLARMIPGAPALPALSNLFGRGAAPSAGGTSALGRMGSMGGMLGTAGGVAGVGLGGYQAATGESRADRMMGIGGALASGALTGAMLGGVPGAVIGGVLGGGSALLANMFANPNQPAGTPAPSPVAPAAPQLSSLMENYWGERSALITVLNGILSSNNEIKSLTQRVVNNTA